MRNFFSVCFTSIAFAAAALHPSRAYGSIALLMEDPYGHLGAWSPTGHAAIYLDHICAVSQVELRRCGPGETGIVISRYHKVLRDDWLAVDVIPYLYAVDDIKEAPLSLSSRSEENAKRDIYWRKHLSTVIWPRGGRAPKGNWTQLVGSTFDRSAHVFELKTTAAQDDAFIRTFNGRRNKSHFNFFFHNCADFARVVLNTYYPGAIHRNYIADFGLMTPKQAAHSLVQYGKKHPELELQQYAIAQIPGAIARSHRIRGVSESIVKTPRWLIPLLVVQPEVVGASALTYYSTGRIEFDKDAPTFPMAIRPDHSPASDSTAEDRSPIAGQAPSVGTGSKEERDK